MQIESFDSLEKVFETMRQAEALANSHVTPGQLEIGWGDFFEVIPERNFGLRAWGRVYAREVLEQDERDLGATAAEVAQTMEMLDGSFARGYRSARTHSAIEPDGELGDVHIVKLRKITREEFEQAERRYWR
jgi:hypothetical protein